jgi:hypothetical protein
MPQLYANANCPCCRSRNTVRVTVLCESEPQRCRVCESLFTVEEYIVTTKTKERRVEGEGSAGE